MKTAPSLKQVSVLFGLYAFVSALTACHSETGTVSHEPTGYLKFLNGKKGEIAEIDTAQEVEVLNDDDTNPVVVSPGKHHVVVRRDGVILMDREILVSDLQTLEMRIP